MADYSLQDGGDTLDLSQQISSDGKSGNINDNILGGDGDDTIIAGPAAPIDFDTKGHAVQDNDNITGGLGDDTMTGGYGNDKFIFNFSFGESQTITHTEYFRDGNTPNENADYKAWTNYLDQLEAWRAQLQADYGDDSDTDTESIELWHASKKSSSPTYMGTEEYDNSYSWTETIQTIESEGKDTITDFGNGNDKLVFNGVDLATYQAYFVVTNDGVNTTISWGNSDSITLQGVQYDKTSLLGVIDFVIV